MGSRHYERVNIMSKPLDLADKYDSSLQEDEYAPDSEPTVKVHMPNFLPKVIVQEDDNVPDFDDEITVVDHDVHETRYPGILRHPIQAYSAN